MWLKLVPIMACVVFLCKACTFDYKTVPFTDDYFDPDDYDVNEMHKLYDFRYILLTINCEKDLMPFSTKVRSKTVVMFVCTNSSYTGYDPSYYKDTLLDNHYNISSSSAESVMIVFGIESSPSLHSIIKMAVFGKIVNLRRCDKLQEISIISSNLERFSDWNTFIEIFSKITNLSKLEIRDTRMNQDKIMRLLSGFTVKELTLRNCSLYDLPHNFLNLTEGLVRLDLSHNHLRFVNLVTSLNKSHMFENLEFMDLSHNELRNGAPVIYAAALMPQLRELILDHNSGLDICKFNHFIDLPRNQRDQKLMTFRNLNMISASFTNTSRLCFGLMKMDNLTVLNISSSMVSTLSELPAFTAPNFTMDLRGNEVTNIEHLSINDYDAIKSKFIEYNNTKVTVLTNVKQLQCDCQYSWLQKTLTDISNLKIQEILCSNGDHLIHLERDRLNCTKFDCGDCVCRRVAKSTTAYCSSGSTHTIPVVEDLSHLYAAFNHIKSFNASLFSDTLVWVDIRANRISRLDLETIRAMFSKQDRHFRLAGNPILCDCRNQALLRSFRLHRHQVDDYKELTCVGNGSLLNDIKEDHICDSERSIPVMLILTIMLGCISVVIIILGLMNFIYYRYRRQIIIFLYVRGWSQEK